MQYGQVGYATRARLSWNASIFCLHVLFAGFLYFIKKHSFPMQTGSGKTYTMGTGYTVGGSTEGVIPQVMQTIFKRIETLNHKADFQLRVSFIEVCSSPCVPLRTRGCGTFLAANQCLVPRFHTSIRSQLCQSRCRVWTDNNHFV